jgi:peroxiredoxin
VLFAFLIYSGETAVSSILGRFGSKRKFRAASANLLSSHIFFIFNQMLRPGLKLISISAVALWATLSIIGQTASNKPKEIFLNANGDRLSNNEFVDLRLANSTERYDPATRTVLDDGTIEFRVANPRQEGTVAPVFDAPDIDAKWISTAKLKGKVIVLNFWFIGCPGCMEEIPKLSKIADKYKDNDDIVFVAVASNTPQELRSFMDRQRFTYRHIAQGLALVKLFNFAGYPRNIVIGRDGKIAYWRTTIHAWDKFESVIASELAKK